MDGGAGRRGAGATLRRAVAAAVAGLTLAGGLGTGPAGALPPKERDPADPPGLEIPFVPPANGFEWWIDSRFGPKRDGIVDFHWNETAGSRFPGPASRYDPDWVRPTSLTAKFDGCPTEDESWAPAGSTAYRYRWELRSPADGSLVGGPVTARDCRFQWTFPIDPVTGRGAPTVVRLAITDPTTGAPWPGYPQGRTFDEQTVQVKDLLVVSLGDSYGSGEGSPDLPQIADPYGNILVPARWQDRRCHRSAAAPSAQAALQLEWSDPHSTVTFLSFACSGATINLPYYADQSPFDPYQGPPAGGFTKPQGTGILGPYVGTEPPLLGDDPDYRDEVKLPSQIDQLAWALTNGGQLPARHVAALTVSGGGNDMGFGPLAGVCTLYYECPQHPVTNSNLSGKTTLKERFQQSLSFMPARYAALAQALGGFTIGKVYLTQYPDPTTSSSSGELCSAILDDVIPNWMQPFLAIGAGLSNAHIPTIPFRMDRAGGGPNDELAWAANVVLPGINGQVGSAAAAHGWTLVDGIADSTANLFAGHGYCASDSWIRRAPDATHLQGPPPREAVCTMPKLIMTPLVFIFAGCVPPATAKTTGTLHPTSDGYRAIAGRLVAKMQPDLIPPPPSTPPQFTDNRSQSQQGANGWLVGKGVGQSCPTSVARCVTVDVAVVTDQSTLLRGVALTRDGAPVACSSAGVTAGGITCRSVLTNSRTYSWNLTFREDGIYRIEAVATARNGTVTHLRREFKVDLHDPVEGTGTPKAEHPQAGGWWRGPVTVTFGGTDAPGGSGVVDAELQLDGGPAQRSGSVTVADEGVRTLTYRPVDLAGRKGPASTLTVRIDRTPPAVTCGSADGAWHPADVAIACTATDGGAGLAEPGDAAFSLSTSVAAGDEQADAPTATRQVCDVAGNCTPAGPVGGNRVDRRPPTIAVAVPTAGSYHLDQVVTAAYTCTDAGSGVASCQGTVPVGAALDTSTTGLRELAVSAIDHAGNATTSTVAYQVVRRPTSLTYDGPVSGDHHDPVGVQARLLDVADGPGAGVGGVELGFALGAAGCRAVTDGAGWAACTLVPDQQAGPASLAVDFAGSTRHTPTSAAIPFTVTHQQTTVAYEGPTVVANRDAVRLSAVLREENGAPVAGRAVTLTVGTGPSAQSCPATTDGTGRGSCTIDALRQPLGPGTISVRFAGDAYFHPAGTDVASLLFEFLPRGTFVVAGGDPGDGRPVTFWGAQWAKANTGPSSFKGFAPATDPGRPSCGGTWTSPPGDGGPPPAVPGYLAVAVSDSPAKAGSSIGGPVRRIVVVRTDPGYGLDPGQPGTGTVVGTVCG